MAIGNVLVYNIATGDTTYPHTGNFTITTAGQLSIDDSNGSGDSYFGDLTHSGGADQPDQDVVASTVPGIVNGDIADLRYRYTFTGNDGSSGTIHFLATNGLNNYGPLIVSDTPLDPSVTYTFQSFNTDGGTPYGNLVPCFTAGTMILTPQGNKLIEELNVGDLVMTRDNGAQPLRWIGQCTVPAQGSSAPVLIKKGVLNNSEDLLVSPNHRMLIKATAADLLFGSNEVLVAAKHLTANDGISIKEGGDVTYIHLLFDKHQILNANDCPSESFFPGREAISALTEPTQREIYELFPELETLGNEELMTTARLCLTAKEAQILAANV